MSSLDALVVISQGVQNAAQNGAAHKGNTQGPAQVHGVHVGGVSTLTATAQGDVGQADDGEAEGDKVEDGGHGG